MSTASRFLHKLYSLRSLRHADMRHQVLTHTEAGSLSAALSTDSEYYLHSAVITYSGAVVSIRVEHYSWATVQLYYAAFYAIRSWLAGHGVGLFYYDRKPFLIEAYPAQSPKRKTKPAHEIAIREFQSRFPSELYSEEMIDTLPALEWIKARREEINYRTERLCDPEPPGHLVILQRYTLRQLVKTYVDDKSVPWELDADHAMLALPLSLIIQARKRIHRKASEKEMSQQEVEFLRRSLGDDKGPIPELLSSFKIG